MDEIHHGVLPLLGKPFLTRIYKELAITPRAGIWGVAEGGSVVAFIAGCADLRRSMQSILWRSFLPLFFLGFRSLISPDVLNRIFAILTFLTHRPESESEGAERRETSRRAELLSIAVSRQAQRRGIGKALVEALEDGLRAWDVTGYYFVATNAEDASSNAFYREMNFQPCGRMKHHKLTLQIYRKLVPSGAG